MKKVIENEITRGILIALLGVDTFITLCLGSYVFTDYGIGHIDVHPFATGILIIIGLALFAFIMRSAGHYKGSEEIEPNFFDRVPLEIYLAVDGGIILGLIGLLVYAIRLIFGFELIFFLLCGIYLACIFLCMSIAVRCKSRTLLTNTLVYMVLDFFRTQLIKLKNAIHYYFLNLTFIWQVLFVIALLGAADLLVYVLFRYGSSAFIMIKLAECGLLALICAKYAIGYQRIRQGTEIIAGGNTDYKIETAGLPKSMEQQAEHLNSINIAVSNAVSKQLRSEKLKTELITNVSHDIKTPLTSIINYIDLIKKEDVQTQPLKDYVEVLGRQADRLKKLVVDLVEASKASTGNITADLATTGLKLLLNQAAGEYTERAENAGLSLTMVLPEDEIYILSDGRLLWRVFDNLLNNACKYSQPGTRVYINLQNQDNKAVITFKNVSKTQLNISPDELMERFVRGDSSRNTEGSGLGLNIAQSLTEILGGEMSLQIDGDLFKVTLAFDVI